jgi:hypothetical protein
MPNLYALRARMAGILVELAAVRFRNLLGKANFNPAQLRIPSGQSGGGQWASEGGIGQLVADKPPPLRRLHPDSTYENDRVAKDSLEHWRRQPTDKIIESLKPGTDTPLIVKPDGTIMQGNTRIKVLQERGYDVGSLPRLPHVDSQPPPTPRRGGGGMKPPGGRFPRM